MRQNCFSCESLSLTSMLIDMSLIYCVVLSSRSVMKSLLLFTVRTTPMETNLTKILYVSIAVTVVVAPTPRPRCPAVYMSLYMAEKPGGCKDKLACDNANSTYFSGLIYISKSISFFYHLNSLQLSEYIQHVSAVLGARYPYYH